MRQASQWPVAHQPLMVSWSFVIARKCEVSFLIHNNSFTTDHGWGAGSALIGYQMAFPSKSRRSTEGARAAIRVQ